ncbi:MAG: hypothetical protein IJW46_01750 [Clostridia bacterium]|nr:hypothetical protein [Clostridia bacterium]
MKTRLFLFVTLLFLVLTLASCDFVSYIPYDTPDEALEERRTELVESIRSLSDADYYELEDSFTYEILVQDAINELNEADSLLKLEAIYKKHKALIEALPRSFQKVLDELKDKITYHVSPSDYREAEQARLASLIEEYCDKLFLSEDEAEAEAVFRTFQAAVYQLTTASEYYAEELAAMKTDYASLLSHTLNYSDYRDAEQALIEETLNAFLQASEAITDKETLTARFEETKATLLLLPTAAARFREEQAALIEEWLKTIADAIEDYTLAETFDRDALEDELLSQTTTEATVFAAASYLLTLIKNSPSKDEEALFDLLGETASTALSHSYTPAAYRESDQVAMRIAVREATDAMDAAEDAKTLLGILDTALLEVSQYETNDALWQKEDLAFQEKLTECFGNATLTPPASLTEASDYEALAAIIDYYAFYQTDYESFLRDTFRVKINFPHKGAQYEINEVYWYCELLRSAVGITGYFETDSDYLVLRLIPYALATKSNTVAPKKVDRYTSVVTLFPDKTYTPREADFNDFAYLQNEKTLSGIWNTQQLWYALEWGYLPLCVENSPAEQALERAKEILREVVSDDMSIEEKAFAIYTWFGKTQLYDEHYENYLYPADREQFPDSLAATLNSFHAEGALFDNYSVCCAFAKAYLILLRMEGIEAYRIVVHKYTDNAIGNLNRVGYGSHAFVALKGSDGKFYYSDTEECYLLTEETLPKYHQFLQIADYRTPYEGAFSRYFNDLDFADTLPDTMLRHLTYRENSIHITEEDTLSAMLDAFAEEEKETCLSLFESPLTPFSVEAILKADSRFGYQIFRYNGFTEYLVYHE